MDANDGDLPRATVARWAVVLTERYVPFEDALERERLFAQWCAQHASVARAWFAGVLWQVSATLPDDDPWCALTATPEGAMRAEGRMFGTSEDGVDLMPRAYSDTTLDASLVALARPLPRRSGALLARAHTSWTEIHRALLPVAGGDLSAVAVPALRWLLWRRGAYVGAEDTYPLQTMLVWIGRAELAAQGGLPEPSALAFEIDQERIDPDGWTLLMSSNRV